MTPLRQALADYLNMRRSLGYKLERPEKLLGQFIAYLEALGTGTVTVTAALAWARLPVNANSNWWSDRLSVVRQFALYLANRRPPHRGADARPAALVGSSGCSLSL